MECFFYHDSMPPRIHAPLHHFACFMPKIVGNLKNWSYSAARVNDALSKYILYILIDALEIISYWQKMMAIEFKGSTFGR